MNFKQTLPIAAMVIMGMGLGACGGDSGNSSNMAPAAQAPPATSSNVGTFIARIATLIQTSPDDSEPAVVAMVETPTSETTEPEAVR